MTTAPIVESAPAGPPTWQGRWAGEADTQAFAQRLATCAALGHFTLALHGDLGAGKTTLVRHLLRALGVGGRIKSPTYAVVEPHTAQPAWSTGPLPVWHFDFYRFNDPREWEDAGFRDIFASPGLKLVEWPEKAAAVMGPIDAELWLQTEDSANADDSEAPRTVTLRAHTATGRAVLATVLGSHAA